MIASVRRGEHSRGCQHVQGMMDKGHLGHAAFESTTRIQRFKSSLLVLSLLSLITILCMVLLCLKMSTTTASYFRSEPRLTTYNGALGIEKFLYETNSSHYLIQGMFTDVVSGCQALSCAVLMSPVGNSSYPEQMGMNPGGISSQ